MAVNKIKLPNNTIVDINDARDVIIGDGVENVVALTTQEYEALTTKDPDTVYIVTDDNGAVKFVALTTAQYEAITSKDSSTLYLITDASGTGTDVIALTTSAYEALTTKDPDTLYIITDASGGGGSGEANVIEIVKVNGTALTPDANKAVDVPVPTESTVSGWGFTKNTGTLTGVTFNGSSATVTSGVAAISATIPTVPTISTNITTDATSDTKTASPKAVKTYVDGVVGDIETLLAAI